MVYGAIEAGGTKFVCAVGEENGKILQKTIIPTADPKKTLGQVKEFFLEYEPDAIGIGTFGPANVDPESDDYGTIATTPKLSWCNYPLLKELKKTFDVPFAIDTDVNAAALGEASLGAAKGLDSCLYITVGTGIGAGAVTGGKLLHGLSHPEMGHILVRRHPSDLYKGSCPYHGDCLEGLAAGPALEARWGAKADALHDRPEVWELEGYYLAQAIMQYLLILSPKKIILGGGVMKQKQLYPIIEKQVRRLLNSYVKFPAGYIVAPRLGDDAGVIGALMLAVEAHKR
ncbi:MAG: ROK family protein [Bacillus sp. (in: firmicutes)]